MNILGIVGSTRIGGNTEALIREVLNAAEEAGAETKLVFLSDFQLNPCNACHICDRTSPPICTIKDNVEKIMALMANADGIVIGSPIYYGGVSAEVKIFIDRVGYLDRCRGRTTFKNRIGGAVVVARRHGVAGGLDQITGFFSSLRMILPGSARVTGIGNRRGEVRKDEEGMRLARALGTEMVQLAKLTESLRQNKPDVAKEMKSVDVKWHGHACFELRGSRITIIVDPFSGIGLPEPQVEADIVLCSHSHRDHNNVGPVLKRGGTVLEGFRGPATYFKGVPIQAVATFHDATSGDQRGTNSVYVMQLEGLTLCHLGDLGHDLTKEQIARIGAIDILFVPVGGGPTIGPELASSIIERLKPKVVIPMHYHLAIPEAAEFLSRLRKVDDFLQGKNNVEWIESSSFTISRKSLPKAQTIIVPSLK